MLEIGHKAIHKLNPSDLNHADKMKFDPSVKLMKLNLINHLKDTVEGSDGVVVYLQLMRLIYLTFNEINMEPLKRVECIWCV